MQEATRTREGRTKQRCCFGTMAGGGGYRRRRHCRPASRIRIQPTRGVASGLVLTKKGRLSRVLVGQQLGRLTIMLVDRQTKMGHHLHSIIMTSGIWNLVLLRICWPVDSWTHQGDQCDHTISMGRRRDMCISYFMICCAPPRDLYFISNTKTWFFSRWQTYN